MILGIGDQTQVLKMAKKDISSICDRCGGTGFEKGKDPETGDPIQNQCPKCVGTGLLLISGLNQDLVDNIESTKEKVDWLKKNVKEILNHFSITEK